MVFYGFDTSILESAPSNDFNESDVVVLFKKRVPNLDAKDYLHSATFHQGQDGRMYKAKEIEVKGGLKRVIWVPSC